MVFANRFHVFHQNLNFRFQLRLIHFITGSRVPRSEGSYSKQKNYHPSSPLCCLINSVNSNFKVEPFFLMGSSAAQTPRKYRNIKGPMITPTFGDHYPVSKNNRLLYLNGINHFFFESHNNQFDPGSWKIISLAPPGSRIPDPGSRIPARIPDPGSRIPRSQIWDPASRIRDPGSLKIIDYYDPSGIPHPGSAIPDPK